MYTIKQAMLLSGALPLADITIYYMDIRAFGKNYEQFFQNAKAMGVEFVKAKPTVVGAGEDGGVVLRYEDQEGGGGGMRHPGTRHGHSSPGPGSPAWDPDGCDATSAKGDDGFLKATHPEARPDVDDHGRRLHGGRRLGPERHRRRHRRSRCRGDGGLELSDAGGCGLMTRDADGNPRMKHGDERK